jgi:hypothetical protein
VFVGVCQDVEEAPTSALSSQSRLNRKECEKKKKINVILCYVYTHLVSEVSGRVGI